MLRGLIVDMKKKTFDLFLMLPFPFTFLLHQSKVLCFLCKFIVIFLCSGFENPYDKKCVLDLYSVLSFAEFTPLLKYYGISAPCTTRISMNTALNWFVKITNSMLELRVAAACRLRSIGIDWRYFWRRRRPAKNSWIRQKINCGYTPIKLYGVYQKLNWVNITKNTALHHLARH